MKRIIFGCIVSLCIVAMGSDSSEFQIDKNTANQIFVESLSEAGVDPSASSSVVLSPSFSFVNVTSLVLTNDYFEVPYSNSIGSIPMLRFSVSVPVLSKTHFELSLLGDVSYAYKEGIFDAFSKTASGHSLSKGALKLHWLPVLVGIKAAYQRFSAVKPYLVATAGAQWLYQSGTLDGIEQGFWVPLYRLGGGLVIFDTSSWFRGISLGVSTNNSFGTSQSVSGWSIDMGVNLML
ncbi:MAG: hypothetical protein HY537_13330 [Deltaproteobacteria bacterium]|nr:hypothetical protein [Deltaproteobacteria bacterium]